LRKLCFAGHALMDNRHGLITDVCLTQSVDVTESEAALTLVARQRRMKLRPKSVGGDKGYHTSRFVEGLLAQHIAPHVAFNPSHFSTALGEGTLGVRRIPGQSDRAQTYRAVLWLGQDSGRPA
jgi:hypothetical protein